jgi:uncharacterized protein (UPF0147 family)
MPFEIGKATPGAGRKGYELEQSQLDKMREILNKDLKIIERIQDADEISPVDEKKLAISQARVSKYIDKLHASKESKDVSVSGSLTIQISEDVAKKYDTPLHTETNSTE